ncbi:MAG TPA: hypothetical protein ENI76_04440 [Ignavibacteria bacterium]|nr:hypothetical protein [Ignavibacteria bacterium]
MANPFTSPIYKIPYGTKLCNIPIERFSGNNVTSGLLSNGGQIFFSPSLLQQNSTNEIDVDEISISVEVLDAYTRPMDSEYNVFTFGPSSLSRTNNNSYRSQPSHYSVIAIMIQTTPPGPTDIINIA